MSLVSHYFIFALCCGRVFSFISLYRLQSFLQVHTNIQSINPTEEPFAPCIPTIPDHSSSSNEITPPVIILYLAVFPISFSSKKGGYPNEGLWSRYLRAVEVSRPCETRKQGRLQDAAAATTAGRTCRKPIASGKYAAGARQGPGRNQWSDSTWFCYRLC